MGLRISLCRQVFVEMNIQQMVDSDVRSELGERFAEERPAISLGEIVSVVQARRNLILGAVIAVVALAITLLAIVTPMYSATAVVILQPQKNSIEGADSLFSPLGSDQPTVQNQVQILTSIELANRVISKLKLDKDPEFSSDQGWLASIQSIFTFAWFPGSQGTKAAQEGQDIQQSEVVQRFLAHLTVVPVGISTAMDVTFQSSSAGKSQQIANAIANAYVDDQLEAKFEATQRTTQWLSDRIADLSRKAQDADAAVQTYKAQHNITTTINGNNLVEQTTADVNGQLILAKTALAEKEAAYQSLRSLALEGKAAASAAAMSSPVISTLRAQDTEVTRQLADLSSRYLPGHPKILDLQAQKENIDSKIAEEVQRTVDAAKNDVSIAAAHVSSLQASLGSLEKSNATQNVASVELTALESADASAKAMYETFLAKESQTQGQEGIETPDARVISYAGMPRSPTFPKKWLILGIAIPMGVILGLLLAFGAEKLDNGFRTSLQTERALDLPVLATVPELRDVNPAADILDKPLGSYAEAIRGLQIGLSVSNIDRPPKIIMVTSSVPREGKTTVAVSLARLSARAGRRTLLIDADLRRPAVVAMLSQTPIKTGLIEALSGKAPLDQCIIKDPSSDLFYLGCAGITPAPADILSSNAMRDLFRVASESFDLVIVDSAPVLPVNDTKILAGLVDSILFVIRWEWTPREAAATAIRSLRDVHAPISGIALSRADQKRFYHYNYGYQGYGSYKSYYGS